ncbi:hypothetical protein [Kineococcus radiotolerans]|uniref:Uncharacterized protein n=1 Tax=Kineococcus radiotolerans (strain ATCC BAA-149 / DSM 14245 / SRS30216) TaxID=266940 RepID=A6WH78_KINRD|nr:hypothetical protein [Kineococcus radiotolerans]ABS06167.1 hypothetical protein Krad_4709 [Kineococcus radiotolerans SRS30216 = ATCC BAA-149]
MAKPAPKTALRKAPAAVHPVAPPAPAAALAGNDLQDPFLPGFDPAPSDAVDAAPAPESAPAAESVAEPVTSPAAPAGQPAAALPMFSVRMDPTLRRRVKRWAAENDTTVQALTAAALSEYLERHDG